VAGTADRCGKPLITARRAACIDHEPWLITADAAHSKVIWVVGAARGVSGMVSALASAGFWRLSGYSACDRRYPGWLLPICLAAGGQCLAIGLREMLWARPADDLRGRKLLAGVLR